MMISYVTYDPSTRALLGGFMQEPLAEHTHRVEVPAAVRLGWPAYRLNATGDGVELIPPTPPAPPTVAEYVAAVQATLDEKAQERNYDNILSACTYATSTNAKFQAEGQACVEWRDAVWAKCYELMAKVEAHVQPQPSITELVGMLPAMVWPV